MLLYLARHAQTASSAKDAYNGRTDLDLTDHGREQARLLGLRLAGVPFAGAVRSPLSRTRQTAALVVPRLVPEVEPGLIEIDYGSWEGLTADEAEARDGELYRAWRNDPTHLSPPGGETAAQVAARALDALERIRTRHEGSSAPVIAFSHKATLRILFCALVGAPLNHYRSRVPQDECALNLIELHRGKAPFLRLWNDTSHLNADPAASTRAGH